MKTPLSLLAIGLVAFALPVSVSAQPAAAAAVADLGPKIKETPITEVLVKNVQGESLGRVEDLVLDLSNGRVVEVLVVSDQTLRLGGKTVAVPPLALIADPANKVYHLDVTLDAFKAAPAFDMSKWDAATQPDQVAAAYHHFGQEPYFFVQGQTKPAPTVALGTLERMSKLINMNVDNLQGVKFGKVESLELDVPNGRIINVFVNQNNFGTKTTPFSTIISPGQFSFNPKRDTLLIDETKAVYAKEPHVVYARGVNGQVISFREQADPDFAAPAALVQGSSFHDIDLTDQVYKSVEKNGLSPTDVEIASLNGHVVLRGNVTTQALRDRFGSIAVTVAGTANVDNQLVVQTAK
jgi:sporulation protein YlmC with PRC-barrel domain